MALYCLLFVFLHVFGTKVLATIQFTSPYQGQTIRRTAASSVSFTWRFSGNVRAVSWGIKKAGSQNIFEGNSPLLSLDESGKTTFTHQGYTGRVNGSRTGDSSSAQVIFTLSSITKNDAKSYLCILEAGFGGTDQYDYVQLVVEDPPIITQPISANASYNEGSPVSISCTATGTPDPDVKWIRNTQVKSSGVKKADLTLSSISKADAGKYTCRANNSVGSDEKQLELTVKYKPKGATIVISAPQNTALQGQDVTITCNVAEAKPPVSEYTFYFNNTSKPVQSVNHFTLTSVQRSQHYGKYKCVARNDVGEGQSGEVFLNINVPVKISLTPNVTVNETNPIDLRCDASGHPTPVIKWKKDGEPEPSSGSNHYHIDSSKRSDSGAYVCIAENVVGRKEMKTFVTVYYAATVKSATPLTTKSWIGQTVTLKCEAEGVPTPTITWKKTPSGMEIKKVTALDNTANVVLNNDQDFGQYTCEVTNGVGAAATKIVQVQQIKAPGSPSITVNIQATSITVSWTAPADDGGSPITAYRVVLLRGSTQIRNENVTNRLTKERFIDGLNKSTNYTVKLFARNFVFEGNATERKIQTKFEGIPEAAEITDLPAETKKVEITLKWKAAQNNGAPITKYTVYRRTINEDGTAQEWIKIKEVKDSNDRKVVVALQKGKAYEFVVTATNSFGDGGKEEGKIKKITVLGDVPSAVVFTYEIKDDEIILNWEEPNNNGAAIRLYTVYQRIVNDEQWTKSGTITDVSKREYVVKVEKGKEYEFMVTATNKYGEYPKKDNIKKDNIKKVKVPGGTDPDAGADTQSGGMNTPIIAGAAAVGVLLIIGLIIFAVWWKRRKTPRDGASLSGTALRNGNEIEDGYQDVSPAAAAQGLQASGPVAEPNYAEVNVSQKKKNRRPVIDEYAQVDRSKKTKKKPKKQPGELDYAELDDLRPRPQPAPVPSGANARPVVRPPAYEGTLYADIAQFGVPQPEPTYDNMPRKDVVYSNVERAF